jgi:hypothetical protein
MGWRPCIESCIAPLGPERAMFEGNFPVRLWGAVERLQAYRHRLFGRREGRTLRRHRDQILPAGLELALAICISSLRAPTKHYSIPPTRRD